MNEYDNLIRVQSGVATREPVPDFLVGLDPISLLDLSWTDPSLGVQDVVWWPAVDQSPPLGPHQVYGVETLAPDTTQQVVIVTRVVHTVVVPPPTAAECAAAVKGMLDSTVRAKGYDDIVAACSFALDPDPQYQAEGQACVAWRSAVRSRFKELMDEVAAQTLPQPTVPDLLAMLPAFSWPS